MNYEQSKFNIFERTIIKKKLKKKETHEISVLCNVLDRKVWVLFCNTGGESRGNRAIVNKLSTLT